MRITRRLLCAIFVVRTENLSKQDKYQPGLKEISLEIEPGEIYGLLGPQGAGKTTLLRLIMNQIRPSDGRVYLFGVENHPMSREVQRQIGYMDADFKVFPPLSGEQYLRILSRLRGGIAWTNIRQLAKDFNVDLSVPFWKLSRSDQRKIALIQAFMHSPDLLILDEPTRDLDPEGRKALYSLIKKARLEGHAILISSTSLSEMEHICDRVAVLFEGRLVAVERGIHLRTRALRTFEMRFEKPVSPEIFKNIPNVLDIWMKENCLHCTLEGNPDALLKTVSEYQVTDFTTNRPSLEEAFQHYYSVEIAAA